MRHLWLDLEDTVITPVVNGWFNTQMINVQKVRAFIQEYKPDQVNIFSFAIWNQQELERFKLGTLPMLERSLGVKISAMPTVDDHMIPAACSVMSMNPATVDFQEMSNFWGKQQTFILNMRHIFKRSHEHNEDIEVVLLDDAVVDEEFFFPKLRLTGRIINIDEYNHEAKIPEALKQWPYFDHITLEDGGMQFRLDRGDTVRENESYVALLNEDLEELGFTLTDLCIEHDCITGQILWR